MSNWNQSLTHSLYFLCTLWIHSFNSREQHKQNHEPGATTSVRRKALNISCCSSITCVWILHPWHVWNTSSPHKASHGLSSHPLCNRDPNKALSYQFWTSLHVCMYTCAYLHLCLHTHMHALVGIHVSLKRLIFQKARQQVCNGGGFN